MQEEVKVNPLTKFFPAMVTEAAVPDCKKLLVMDVTTGGATEVTVIPLLTLPASPSGLTMITS